MTTQPQPQLLAPAGDTLLAGPVVFPAAGLGEPGPAEPLPEHVAAYGPLPTPDPTVLLDALATSGLSGHGGGHFPVARKWQAVRDATQERGLLPIVVGNAAEGEPASAKDAALLARRPHLVLDGLAAASAALGATETVLWLHDDALLLRARIAHATHERRLAGLRESPVRVVPAPHRYLSGESSAVMRALSGGPALPELALVPAATAGADGRPTLLHNAETLARIGLVARDDRYRPTSLVTVLAGGRRTVLEVEPTCTVGEAVRRGGWPAGADPQAVLVGGYGGAWLPWAAAAGLSLDPPGLREAGVAIGAGILVTLPADACGVAETARVVGYLAASSARQCGPCVFGLAAVAGVLDDLRHGRARRSDVRRLQGWAAEIRGRGACNHPDGAVRLALSALTTFADDLDRHARRRPCAVTGRSVLPLPRVGS